MPAREIGGDKGEKIIRGDSRFFFFPFFIVFFFDFLSFQGDLFRPAGRVLGGGGGRKKGFSFFFFPPLFFFLLDLSVVGWARSYCW